MSHLGSGERLVRQHDQVGQVRAGQEQRRPVGHEECPVEKRPLIAVSPLCGVEDDRREEGDRGVEVQHRGDKGLQSEQSGEKDDRTAADSLDPGTDGGKEPICFHDCADQQQARDQHERRPRLCEGVQGRIAHRLDRAAGLLY